MTPGARGALAATLAALFVTGSAARFQVDTEPLALPSRSRRVVQQGGQGRYVPTGHLVYHERAPCLPSRLIWESWK